MTITDARRIYRFGLGRVPSALAAQAVAVVLASSAAAHEWYPLSCCSGIDCASVSVPATMTGTGYIITVKPGDHPMVQRETTFTVPFDDVQPSPDGLMHLCIGNEWGLENSQQILAGHRLICIFMPGGVS